MWNFKIEVKAYFSLSICFLSSGKLQSSKGKTATKPKSKQHQIKKGSTWSGLNKKFKHCSNRSFCSACLTIVVSLNSRLLKPKCTQVICVRMSKALLSATHERLDKRQTNGGNQITISDTFVIVVLVLHCTH